MATDNPAFDGISIQLDDDICPAHESRSNNVTSEYLYSEPSTSETSFESDANPTSCVFWDKTSCVRADSSSKHVKFRPGLQDTLIDMAAPKGILRHPHSPESNPAVQGQLDIEMDETDTKQHRHTEEELEIASTLILDARYCHQMEFKKDRRSLWYYRVYSNQVVNIIFFFFVWLDLSLAIFEAPSVNESTALPSWATCFLEAMCLFAFMTRVYNQKQFHPNKTFWSNGKIVFLIILIMVFWLDLLIFVIMSVMKKSPRRYARLMRPLFIASFSRNLSRMFVFIRSIMLDVLFIALFVLTSVIIFTMLSVKMFSNRNLTSLDGAEYYSNFGDTLWNLFVLSTPESFIDTMLPSYNSSGVFSVFFMLFAAVCTYIPSALLLAVIYKRYKDHIRYEIQLVVISKRKKIEDAFKMFQVPDRITRGLYHVTLTDQWNELMGKVAPELDQSQRDLLMAILKDEDRQYLDKEDFLKIPDLLDIKLTKKYERQPVFLHKCPTVYNSKPSRWLKTIVQSKYYQPIFDAIILTGTVLLVVRALHDITGDITWPFVVLYGIDVLIKIYVLGIYKYCSQFWNIYDVILVVLSLVFIPIDAAKEGNDSFRTVEFIMVLKILRLLNNFQHLDHFRVMYATIGKSVPFMLSSLGILFIFYYTFAILGVELFSKSFELPLSDSNQTSLSTEPNTMRTASNSTHTYFHIIKTTPPSTQANPCQGLRELRGTQFATLGYCDLTFRDVLSSCVLLVSLSVGNNWHIIADGYATITSPASYLYFSVFYAINSFIMIKLFLVLVIHVFGHESVFNNKEIITELESRIREYGLDGKQGNRRQRKQSVRPPEPIPQASDRPATIDVLELEPSHFGSVKPANVMDASIEKGQHFQVPQRENKTMKLQLQQLLEATIDPYMPWYMIPSHYGHRRMDRTSSTIYSNVNTQDSSVV